MITNSTEKPVSDRLSEARGKLRAEIAKVVVGQDAVLDALLVALLCRGHVLMLGVPGLGKTLMARTIAHALEMDYRRIQFTPDLMPSDITGTDIIEEDPETGRRRLEFFQGPLFANFLLADEINRAPPKTQAALLEAMQERQVTIEGETIRLDAPFLVIATQNPIEYEGTYPLPEAQLDRFLLRVNFGYPSRDDEWTLLERRLERATDEIQLDAVIDRPGLVEMQEAIEQVHVAEPIGRYVVDIVTGTRTSQRVQVGASPRGSLALLKLSRCRAVLEGRDFVTPEDVKAVAGPALSHRLMLRPELWVQRIRPEDVVREVLETVPTPAAEGLPAR
jgi:MoxR-like ATPase